MVTITLSNNFISAAEGNHLNADLTGDGNPDLRITGAAFYNNHLSFTDQKLSAEVMLNGIQARGYFTGYPLSRLYLGSRRLTCTPGSPTHSLTGSIPIFFKDLHINGGARTAASLEVTVVANKVQLDSLTYTSRHALPDQGSSLALLAMGAGGVLALRRWRNAQPSPGK
jgi:hypothetical protein